MRKYLLFFAIMVAAALYFSSCSQVQGTQAAYPPQNLPVLPISSSAATTYLEYSATVEGKTNVEIRPQVSGLRERQDMRPELAPARKSVLSRDLSLGGCYLDTVGETMTGEIVCFRVSLADGDWLYLEGEVRHHTRGKGFGVRFLDLEQQQEEKIEALLGPARQSGSERVPIAANLVED